MASKNSDSGPYKAKPGPVEGGVHYGAGMIGKDYGIAKNKEVASRLGNSSK